MNTEENDMVNENSNLETNESLFDNTEVLSFKENIDDSSNTSFDNLEQPSLSNNDLNSNQVMEGFNYSNMSQDSNIVSPLETNQDMYDDIGQDISEIAPAPTGIPSFTEDTSNPYWQNETIVNEDLVNPILNPQAFEQVVVNDASTDMDNLTGMSPEPLEVEETELEPEEEQPRVNNTNIKGKENNSKSNLTFIVVFGIIVLAIIFALPYIAGYK